MKWLIILHIVIFIFMSVITQEQFNRFKEDWEQEKTELNRKIEDLIKVKETKEQRQITYPIDPTSQDILSRYLDDVLPYKMLKLQWDNVFRYFSFFESLDGWNIANPAGSGTIEIQSGTLFMETDNSSGHIVVVNKIPGFLSDLSFKKNQRFRTVFRVNSVSDVEFHVLMGYGASGITGDTYGFLLENNVLKGYTSNGTSSSTVNLATISANDILNVEARLDPNRSRVDFYVANLSEEGFEAQVVHRGLLTATLPRFLGDYFQGFIGYDLKTNANAAKIAYVSHFEYIQLK